MKASQYPRPEAGDFRLSKEREAEAAKILKRYPEGREASAVLPLLDLAQRENGGWLSREAMDWVAQRLSMAPIRVYEVASFFTMFNLKPVGTHLVQLCRTTPCWLRGSNRLAECIRNRLKIDLGETSPDGRFTFVEVECLGACANAPVVQINDDYYEDLDEKSLEHILDKLARGESPEAGSQIGRVASEPVAEEEHEHA